MSRLIKWSIVAALVLAFQGSAQAAGTPTSPAQSGAASNPGAKHTIDQIHGINVKMIEWGKLAAEKATTPNLKEFGQRIQTEHERLERELAQMAQQRGIALTPPDQVFAADPGHTGTLKNLEAQSGLDFDKTFIDIVTAEREKRVPELKQLRDATPGTDAELKKWVDEMEVLMEKTRNEARNVRQAVNQQAQQQQRQGRKP
jgi:putative membrane protein